MTDTRDPRSTVLRFWELMRGNDFDAVGAVLAPDVVVEWPQTAERFRGAGRFAAVNAEYPHTGPWTFEVRSLLVDGDRVVTETVVRDDVQRALAISFFTVRDGAIVTLREYWPDNGPAPSDRAHLAEPMDVTER